jgi:hypothetical protein
MKAISKIIKERSKQFSCCGTIVYSLYSMGAMEGVSCWNTS